MAPNPRGVIRVSPGLNLDVMQKDCKPVSLPALKDSHSKAAASDVRALIDSKSREVILWVIKGITLLSACSVRIVIFLMQPPEDEGNDANLADGARTSLSWLTALLRLVPLGVIADNPDRKTTKSRLHEENCSRDAVARNDST